MECKVANNEGVSTLPSPPPLPYQVASAPAPNPSNEGPSSSVYVCGISPSPHNANEISIVASRDATHTATACPEVVPSPSTSPLASAPPLSNICIPEVTTMR